uniref:Uncharacterized protein n=1 Tax=Arundo donax TaxID=35708 RepID=A0A0A9CSF3_ARUDO
MSQGVLFKKLDLQMSWDMLDSHADPPLAASRAPGHRLGRPQPPHPGREPPHGHLPRLRLTRGRRFLATLPLTATAAAHVPFQQRRRGPAPPPAAGCAGRRRRLKRPPAQAARRPERRRRRSSARGGGAVPGAHPRLCLGTARCAGCIGREQTGRQSTAHGARTVVWKRSGQGRETLGVVAGWGGVGKWEGKRSGEK